MPPATGHRDSALPAGRVAGNLFFERSNLLFNVLLWPACLLLHLLMLRGVDDERPRRWWPVVHVGNVL